MNIFITCIERGKVKTYSGTLISNDIGVVIFSSWDNKGSTFIKRIKKQNIIRMAVEKS